VLSDRLEINWYYQFWRWNNGGELPVILARMTSVYSTIYGTLELDTFFVSVLERQLDTKLEQLWTCWLLCDFMRKAEERSPFLRRDELNFEF
jgi:hypothetical protein